MCLLYFLLLFKVYSYLLKKVDCKAGCPHVGVSKIFTHLKFAVFLDCIKKPH